MAILPGAAAAAVIINEVLFDPAGSDTGLEQIELYNSDGAAASLGGWELYPDGIGYFTFPQSFSMPAGAFAVVHLRLSGNDDAKNLYHASASSNMGNSSGSVALFRSGSRSKDTIADFVRYHKPGSSERKTWESTAAEAGLWTAGSFVDVTNSTEGNSIALLRDGGRGSSVSWGIVSSPTVGGTNGAATSSLPDETPSPTPSPAATSTPATADGGRPPIPSLRADAGSDAMAIAGVVVEFRGVAFGLDQEPLPGARFLWNFGDGSVKEGKAITHIYHFPGAYHVNLTVSSGELTGSDWRLITVLRPDIRVSEVKPGPDGFVELWNKTPETIDLSGLRLSDGNGAVFSIPPNTRVGPRSAIVFPSAITWLDPKGRVALADARGDELDAMILAGSPGSGGSWELAGNEVRLQQQPTPGAVESAAMPVAAAAAPVNELSKESRPGGAMPSDGGRPASAETPAADVFPSASPSAQESTSGEAAIPPRGEMSVLMAGVSRGWIYFSGSFVSSILIALAAVGMKRWLG